MLEDDGTQVFEVPVSESDLEYLNFIATHLLMQRLDKGMICIIAFASSAEAEIGPGAVQMNSITVARPGLVDHPMWTFIKSKLIQTIASRLDTFEANNALKGPVQ